jgi:hypothetical protein
MLKTPSGIEPMTFQLVAQCQHKLGETGKSDFVCMIGRETCSVGKHVFSKGLCFCMLFYGIIRLCGVKW